MPLNETWSNEIATVFTNSDFGFLGNLIPLILVIGISWALSKKPRDALLIQFPLVLVFKVIFPFFHFAFILISFALLIMNLLGSKGDLLADVKETPQIIRSKLFEPTALIKAKKEAFKEDQKEVFQRLKDQFRRIS